MKYMEIIQKSISNAWKFKFLWLFGFFVAAADGGGWGSNLWSDAIKGKEKWGEWGRFGQLGDIYINPIIILYVVLAMLAIWVIFWVLSILSEGALIHGISRKELNLDTNFGECWSYGLNKFFRLLGIMLLAILAVIFMLMFLLTIVVPSFFASKVLGVFLAIMAFICFFILLIPIICVEGWAIRYATLYDVTWLDSIGKGWKLFAANFGKTLGVAFSSFFAQFVMGLLFLISLVIVAIPFIIVGVGNFWIGLIPGVLFGLIILILWSAFIGTFASSVWTIGFMRLTNYEGQPVLEEDLIV